MQNLGNYGKSFYFTKYTVFNILCSFNEKYIYNFYQNMLLYPTIKSLTPLQNIQPVNAFKIP